MAKETTMAPKDPFHDAAKKLKEVLEVIEKLRARRKELKTLLNKEALIEKEEAHFASELSALCATMVALDESREKLYEELRKVAPASTT